MQGHWRYRKRLTALARAAVAGGLMALSSGGPAAAEPAQAARAPDRFEATYDIYLGGLRLAQMDVAADLGTAGYRAEARMATDGMVGALYRAFFAARAEGRFGGPAAPWLPSRFTADSGNSSKRQFLAMDYGEAGPRRLEANPPFQPKPWELDPLVQTGAVDPLSGALSALAAQSDAGLCDRRVEIFDGRRRYAIDLGDPVAEEDGRRCEAVYSRVAGFKPKMMKKPDFRFSLWFALGRDGLWHVERAMGETSLGMAVIRRRAVPAG